MEKQGQALAIYVSSQQRGQTGNDDSKPIMGLSLRELESMVGKGERIAAETIGLNIAKGEEEPLVFLRTQDDWDRALVGVFFSDKLEALMVVLDEPPMTQDAIVRLLDLFAERNTWTREDPIRPEFPLHWKRSDGKYFATASSEKGAFVIGNPSFVSLK